MIRLYDFQQQALDAEARHRVEHPDETRLVIVLPTGTGKGTILAERAARFCESDWEGFDFAWQAGFKAFRKRALILVHTDELVNDLAARCALAVKESEFPIVVGIVKAGLDGTDADIIVASVQTLANPERRARIHDVGLVIVDECHHATADSYQAILRHFGCMPLGPEIDPWESQITSTPALGFTATLERTDGAGLGQVWQNVVFTRDISWAVRKGFLVQPIGYRLEIEPGTDGTSFATDAATLDTQICDSIAPERIVEKWQELAASRQTIVFAPLVRSAKAICYVFNKAGVSAAVVHGDMPDDRRRQFVQEFKSGELQVLVNAMVLTEGFDHPGVSCVIVARPTKSRPLFIQMAGRGLRRQPGIPVEDQDCILITLADATSDICSVADLSDRPLDRKADGAMTVMEDAFDIGKDLEDAARHWTGKVNASEFDPIVARSSKVWARTKGGHWFLPISDQREYVFLLGNEVWLRERDTASPTDGMWTRRLHADLPDIELAMQIAEDEATERGGDLGAMLADRSRPWRNKVPSSSMQEYAMRLGLGSEMARIMTSKAGGKAGKLSDLIRRVEASRSIDRAVARINDRKATA